MKEVMVKKFEAFDGKLFDTAPKCREYEGGAIHLRLADRSAAEIQAAIDGKDPDLADAYEQLGKMIGDARRKRGELKWSDARKKAATAAALTTEPVRESAA